MRKRILYYAVKYGGDFNKISTALLNNEDYEDIEYQGSYITILDKEYPSAFQQLRFKPWILFYEGNLDLLQKQMLAVVGSRIMSHYGEACCEELITNVKKDYGIVSGMAKGIDAYAHHLAFTTNRGTIAVIGCGIDIVYPLENKELYQKIKKDGLIISEYPNGSKPYACHFPWRNRLIAALGFALVVIEAKRRSGTLISVNEALELGREVYCFPHSYFAENGQGCNLLIMQGCNIITSREDIIEI